MPPVLLHETIFAPNAHWCSPAVIFWAFDLKTQKHLTNRLADKTATLVFWRKSPAGRYEVVIRKNQGL